MKFFRLGKKGANLEHFRSHGGDFFAYNTYIYIYIYNLSENENLRYF